MTTGEDLIYTKNSRVDSKFTMFMLVANYLYYKITFI